MEVTDAELVHRVRQGDAEAFGELVERYLQPAYAIALARLGEIADAEDVCQDAFIRALERIEECRDPERFGAWLLGVVRNRALDHRRYRRVRDALPLHDAVAQCPLPDPERQAGIWEMHSELLVAMKALTELQREVLLLYDFEGWTHSEIASKLGISPESARVHLHRGRATLRSKLGNRYLDLK